MQYTSHYQSPLGGILLAADDTGLTGLWFEKQKYFARCLEREHEEKETPVLKETKHWLDIYFSGKEPDFMVPFPYVKTMTYGEVAAQLASRKGLAHMYAQAVGGAVGHNEISILVPCHRVVGTGGSLTGYAGGIDRKVKLLTLEKADMQSFFVPKKGTAL